MPAGDWHLLLGRVHAVAAGLGLRQLRVDILDQLLDEVGFVQQRADPQLGFEVHLVVQLVPDAILVSLAILTDEQKDREKDRLE
jgi:hypothetical protein